MLQEIGYTTEYVKDCINNNTLDKLSIIDPYCWSGTFLYSATDIIVRAIKELDKTDEEKAKLIEEIVNNNVFGLDVEKFSIYLAEMSILLRLLPFIYNSNYKNPLEKKLKLFKTKDSIAEFIELNTQNQELFTALDYQSFMRNQEDIVELKTSIIPSKRRFDYYITKSKEDIEFLDKYNKNNNLIGDFYFNHNDPRKPLSRDFYFDNSYIFTEEAKNYTIPPSKEKYYNVPNVDKSFFLLKKTNAFIQKSTLKQKVRPASYGFDTFGAQYKITCHFMMFQGWHFLSLENIMPVEQICITSSNKPEALYLFSLLNSETNKRLLKILKYNPNERNFSITLTNIKQFIRVPKLETQEQQSRKQKIIELTEEMKKKNKLCKFLYVLFPSVIKTLSFCKCLCNNTTSSFAKPPNPTGFVKLDLLQSIAVRTHVLVFFV